MRIPASAQIPEAARNRIPPGGDRWYTAPGIWVAISAVAFLVIAVLPMVLVPRTQWAELREPELSCEVIDLRVGEKLAVLADRGEARAQAIVNRMAQQREVARRHCRSGHLDAAMTLYRLLDHALTRYVNAGTAPNLPR